MGLFNSSAAAWRQQFGFYITELNQVIVLDFGSYKHSDPNILLQTCSCGWDHVLFSFYYLFLKLYRDSINSVYSTKLQVALSVASKQTPISGV